MKTKTKTQRSTAASLLNQEVDLIQFCATTYTGLLNFCNGVEQHYLKNKNTWLVSGLAFWLMVVLSCGGPSFYQITFFEANLEFVDSYLVYLGDVYSGFIKNTFDFWGQLVYNLPVFGFALSDTANAYAAMFQYPANLLTQLFEGSGQVFSSISYALATPARVMAKTLP